MAGLRSVSASSQPQTSRNVNFYNDNDPDACTWLQGLMDEGLIPPGVISSTSITDLNPDDLKKYVQAHFFCGIAGWPLALQLAGWPTDRPIWTGSCPCQPFSDAGKGEGFRDERHLWPVFFDLIRQCRPPIVVGEQVASKAALGWLDRVFHDLEGEAYPCAAADLCAPGVGAPHIRQRLYWGAFDGLAFATGIGREMALLDDFGGDSSFGIGKTDVSGSLCSPDGLSDTDGQREGDEGETTRQRVLQPGGRRGLGHADDEGSQGHNRDGGDGSESGRDDALATGPTGASSWLTAGPWDDFLLAECRDGKTRRVPTQPALFPLADGLSYKLARRGSIRPPLLKGAGNAIVPQLAAGFLQTFVEAAGGLR